ncbi:glucokinase [Agaricicola taiwanensis]|uniref:Glucokinase n=1 Tax=Agaricicola taiwanensis TaxID=591372 RepID=A0A8J2YLC7_9RHOB|nr:glucokinase [Agaricicola taiwanensis]GGE50647.1 glucokinase [Agaricicola taiwanensis]
MISPHVLVADIGGTNSRFALAHGGQVTDRQSMANDGLPDFETAVDAYLSSRDLRPERAVLAVAGPVQGRKVQLTNRDWMIDADVLERRFGFRRVDLLNDFAAVAHSLPLLGEGQVKLIGSVVPEPAANKIVLGPGTGLGVAALIHDAGLWRAVPSEGGHVEFAATTPLELEVFTRLRAKRGRVSAEYVVSGGLGLENLDWALAEIAGESAEERSGPEIEKAARAGERRAGMVMDLFTAALARFAGDMALTFIARGGVYIGGGIMPKIMDTIDHAEFRALFEAKAPHQDIMAGIGTAVILEKDPGLVGCAAYAMAAI